MRLLFATSEFVYGLRPRAGFPLILNDDMTPAQPFHDYLRHRLLEQGKLLDIKTWEAYGRRLWDFSRFLHDNGLSWDQPFQSRGQSVLRAYRDWQAQDLTLERTTINARLSVVTDMYRWALNRRLVTQLPFEDETINVHGIEHDAAHITGGHRTIRRPDVFLDEWTKEPAFLLSEQLRIARASIRSSSQRLLFDLMARVGLRSTEARTFPLAYVFDPSKRPDLRRGTLIDVRLDPRDMAIKFRKPRVVHVPFGLMEDLYAYSLFERNKLSGAQQEVRELVLTTHGRPYSKESAVKVFKDLGERVGFRIRPLMLRHSYAIHTLLLLRRHPEIKLEPLMYVRDRLGHRSVQTTMTYLAQIERLLGSEVMAMLDEFDALYGVTPLPPLSAVSCAMRATQENRNG